MPDSDQPDARNAHLQQELKALRDALRRTPKSAPTGKDEPTAEQDDAAGQAPPAATDKPPKAEP